MTILLKQDTRGILIPTGDDDIKSKKKLERYMLNFQEKVIITDIYALRASIKEYVEFKKNERQFIDCHDLSEDVYNRIFSKKMTVPYSILYEMFKGYMLIDSVKISAFRKEPRRNMELDLRAYHLFFKLSSVHSMVNFKFVFPMIFQKNYLAYTTKSESFLKSYIWSKDIISIMNPPSIIEDRVYEALIKGLVEQDIYYVFFDLIQRGILPKSTYKRMYLTLELHENEVINESNIRIISHNENEIQIKFNRTVFYCSI